MHVRVREPSCVPPLYVVVVIAVTVCFSFVAFYNFYYTLCAFIAIVKLVREIKGRISRDICYTHDTDVGNSLELHDAT